MPLPQWEIFRESCQIERRISLAADKKKASSLFSSQVSWYQIQKVPHSMHSIYPVCQFCLIGTHRDRSGHIAKISSLLFWTIGPPRIRVNMNILFALNNSRRLPFACSVDFCCIFVTSSSKTDCLLYLLWSHVKMCYVVLLLICPSGIFAFGAVPWIFNVYKKWQFFCLWD